MRIDAQQEDFKQLDNFLQTNKVELPISCHMVAASAMSDTMLTLLKEVSQRGGNLPDRLDGARLLTQLASLQCETLVDSSWDNILQLVADAKEKQEERLLKDLLLTPVEAMPKPGFVVIYRLRLFCHIVKTLGEQYFIQQEGPAMIHQKCHQSHHIHHC